MSTDFSDSTGDLDHKVQLDRRTRKTFLGYLLLSKYPSNKAISDKEIQNVMEEVMRSYAGIDVKAKDSTKRFDVNEINADPSIAQRALNSLEFVEDELVVRIDGFHYYKYDGNTDGANQKVNTSIYDGQGDMYDVGNMIYISQPNQQEQEKPITYGQQYSYESHQFASHMRHPFQAVMWVEEQQKDGQKPFFIRVAGNTGADGYGEVDTFEGSMLSDGESFYMKYTVFQISGAS